MKIFYAGDSTCAKYSIINFPQTGIGEDPSCPQGKVDDTHMNQKGARIFAGLVTEGLKELGGIYSELLVEGF